MPKSLTAQMLLSKSFAELGKDFPAFRNAMVPIDIEVPPQSDFLLDPNPCVRHFGPLPTTPIYYIGQFGNSEVEHRVTHCCDCKHLKKHVADQQIKIGRCPATKPLHVCPFREETIMPRIMHELEWNACMRFEPEEKT